MSFVNEENLAKIKGEIAVGTRDKSLSHLSTKELLALRSEIDALLPDVSKMDLHKELALQFTVVKEYQAQVLEDDEVEPNKVATVVNATTATLGQLIKLQESLEREETLKKMEMAFLDAIKTTPDEVKDAFFKEYARIAGEVGLS